MIQISPEARELIRDKAGPVFLEMPKAVTSCCFDLQESPVVRFGKPRDPSNYEERIIGEVPVWVPRCLPDEGPLTITVSRFLGIRRLVVEGWRLI